MPTLRPLSAFKNEFSFCWKMKRVKSPFLQREWVTRIEKNEFQFYKVGIHIAPVYSPNHAACAEGNFLSSFQLSLGENRRKPFDYASLGVHIHKLYNRSKIMINSQNFHLSSFHRKGRVKFWTKKDSSFGACNCSYVSAHVVNIEETFELWESHLTDPNLGVHGPGDWGYSIWPTQFQFEWIE